MITIEIRGLDALERKLGRLGAIEVLKPPMHKATKLIYAETQKYPPASHKPMRWKSAKQRAWFFAALHRGEITVPYRRRHSGGLAGGWVERVETHGKTLVGIVGNSKSYGPWVMDPERQAGYHQGTWPTTDDIVRKRKQQIVAEFDAAIRRAIHG